MLGKLIIKALAASLLLSYASVEAATFDFTSNDWSGINGSSYSIGTGVTLSSVGGNMTFNNSDGGDGCGNVGPTKEAIISSTTLDCTGDGIGITNDEITEGGSQSLTVTFDSVVNILAIDLLDLFADESTGEIAVIEWGTPTQTYNSHAISTIDYPGGGYWEIDISAIDELTMSGITSFTLTGFNDSFSDFSLARIEISAVPVPAAIWFFGTALIGFVGISRRTRV
jgi:hypothetical protein